MQRTQNKEQMKLDRKCREQRTETEEYRCERNDQINKTTHKNRIAYAHTLAAESIQCENYISVPKITLYTAINERNHV